MAVTASFQNDTLSVLGDNNDNTIEASRNAAGPRPASTRSSTSCGSGRSRDACRKATVSSPEQRHHDRAASAEAIPRLPP